MDEQLRQLIIDLRSKKYFAISEDATKTSIILRLLNILGWNIFDNNEVYPEYIIGGKRVDYCLRQNQQNKVFLEVKKTAEDLEIHQEQLLNYAFHEGIEIAILTNGLSWWFYLPLNHGSWEQRKFFSIDILQQPENEIISNFVDFLAKESILSEKAIKSAKERITKNHTIEAIRISLPKAWNRLIEETNESLIELVNDTNEKICGYRSTDEQIAEFLGENKNQLLLDAIETFPDKAKANKRISIEKASEYIPTGYAGKQPLSFTLNNKKIRVKYWIDILAEVCNFLYNSNQGNFEQKVSLIKGRKRVYFSKNKDELRVPMQIKSSVIYVEANLGANSIVKLSENLAASFGYNSNLQIVVA